MIILFWLFFMIGWIVVGVVVSRTLIKMWGDPKDGEQFLLFFTVLVWPFFAVIIMMTDPDDVDHDNIVIGSLRKLFGMGEKKDES